MKAHFHRPLRTLGAPFLFAAVSAALAGCGGDGHSARSVSLSSKDDVLRELGNLSAFVDFSGLTDGPTPPAAATASTTKARFVGTALKSRTLAPLRAAVGAKAATVYDCDSGSYSEETLSGTYTFALFDSTPRTVSIYREENNQCVFVYEGGYREIYDGHYERGSYTPETGDQYAYLRFGTANSVYRYREELSGDSDYPSTEELQGLLERRAGDSDAEVRADDFRYHYTEPGYNADITLGDGELMKLLTADTGLRADGSIYYSTSVCRGGTLRYTTTTPISIPQEGTAQGVLKMESGKESATVTLNADGSATVQFADGSSTTLTAGEVLAALDESPC
ncbi:hypothetical protein [Solimonas variicoloris]|uniref:hypothetical protein n=1 Tax=Solimonas variicoloris TaxID=254408 RepID=UPI0003817557|nr:hypothetical protein [Solimonas variicoloris]